MGDSQNYSNNTIDVTFSTRTLLRWADLSLRYQPLAKQGIHSDSNSNPKELKSCNKLSGVARRTAVAIDGSIK